MTKSGLSAAHSSTKIAASTPLPAAPPNGAGIRPLRKPAATAFSKVGRSSRARVSGSGSARTAAASSRRWSRAKRAAALSCSCSGVRRKDTVIVVAPRERWSRAGSRSGARVCQAVRARRLGIPCTAAQGASRTSEGRLPKRRRKARVNVVGSSKPWPPRSRRSCRWSTVGQCPGTAVEPQPAHGGGERPVDLGEQVVQGARRHAEPAADAGHGQELSGRWSCT